MSKLLPVLCLVAGSLLTLWVIWLLVRRGIRQLAVAAAYRDVAQRLGLQVDTRGTSVRGHLGDRRIWIGEVMEGHGTERRVECRGVISLERPLGLGLLMRRRGRTERLLRRRHGAETGTGDRDFDQLVHVYADDPPRIATLVDDRVKEAIRGLARRCPDLVITDDDVQVWLRSPEDDAGRLYQLLEAMVGVATALDRARQSVPTPEPLGALVPSWERVARELGLDLEPWLPAMAGAIDGRRVLLTARRTADGYGSLLQVAFRPHGELGLLIRPQVEPDGYWSVGQDIQVGDPEFDRAFVIKGYDPGLVCASLSQRARLGLLALRENGPLVVDDRGIYLMDAPIDADAVRALITSAVDLAATMGW